MRALAVVLLIACADHSKLVEAPPEPECRVDGECDDSNPCTANRCAEGGKCEHPPLDGTRCEDGDPCTAPDTCVAGYCESGAEVCACRHDDECAFDAGACVVPRCLGGMCSRAAA